MLGAHVERIEKNGPLAGHLSSGKSSKGIIMCRSFLCVTGVTKAYGTRLQDFPAQNKSVNYSAKLVEW